MQLKQHRWWLCCSRFSPGWQDSEHSEVGACRERGGVRPVAGHRGPGSLRAACGRLPGQTGQEPRAHHIVVLI